MRVLTMRVVLLAGMSRAKHDAAPIHHQQSHIDNHTQGENP
jgi:hypothetical protein